ncbi:homogentisate 1,2-dioxygenase [Rhizorhabdus argentea]|uniref:homogentisate 1,2-dioxygenase n=1 Tax=Rhizorhabdus argentea TaxID=1387174 RepID=UPI0030ECB038
MAFYQRQGSIPHKRHTQFRDAQGKLRYEELFSTRGFEGPYALLYHESFPVEVLEVLPAGQIDLQEWELDTQENRCMYTGQIESEGDILSSRRVMAFNDDVVIAIANPDRGCDGFYRNGLCDEMITVIEGEGVLQSIFGILPYETGDIILVPRGTTYDLRPSGQSRLIVMESRTPIRPPKKYAVDNGQLSEHSPFCERDFKTPVLPAPIIERGRFKVTGKVGNRLTTYVIPNHPFDVVGWDGSLYPIALNIRDFEPVTRRIHTMPDEQQAFETVGAAICCLVPRLADYHPESIPSPPLHSNIDCDEILFNLGGTLLGWGGGGLMTFHPRGVFHAAKVYEETIGMERFDGLALMIDCFKPLKLTAFSKQCADPEYNKVWLKADA